MWKSSETTRSNASSPVRAPDGGGSALPPVTCRLSPVTAPAATRALPIAAHDPAPSEQVPTDPTGALLAAPEHVAAVQTVRELLAAYRDHEDLISIGAYRSGANPTVDAAITMRDEINRFLRQAIADGSSVAAARAQLLDLAQRCTTARKPAAPVGMTKLQAPNPKPAPNSR